MTPIDSRTDPGGLPSPRHRLSTRIIATSLAALVVVLSMISWTLWLSWQLEAGAAINDTGSLRMRANRVAVELMRPQEGRKVRTDEQILLMDETIARLAKGNRRGRCSFPMTKASASSGARWPATGARS